MANQAGAFKEEPWRTRLAAPLRLLISVGRAAKARDLARRLASGTGGLSRRRDNPSAITTAMVVTRPMGMRSSGSPG